MKIVSYILLGVALLLAIIALVFMVKDDREKRIAVLESLKKARMTKAAKKTENEFQTDLDNEIEQIENVKTLDKENHASKKEELE